MDDRPPKHLRSVKGPRPVRPKGVGYNPAASSTAGSRVASVNSRRRSASAGVGSGVSEQDDQLFLKNLPVIDAAVAYVCRRHRLTASEADEFSAEVRLHFIERNYEPLRRFEGRSTLRTYLITVVNHLFLDYRNRLWESGGPRRKRRESAGSRFSSRGS